jgi:hypothetical protein
MTATTMTAAGVGLFLLVWAFFRGGLLTTLLAVFGAVLLGSGVLNQIARSAMSVIATVLNGLGGAL